MTLKSNALITVDELLTSMGLSRDDIQIAALRIYNSSTDATAATVEIVSNTMTLTVTGGVNADTTAFDLTNASYDTIGELITAINALSKGWIVNRLCSASQTSADLYSIGSTSVLLVANELTLNAFNSSLLEELINSSSQFIASYCRRVFTNNGAQITDTEYYDGIGEKFLILKNFPASNPTVILYEYSTETDIYTYEEHVEYELHSEQGMLYKYDKWTVGTKNFKVTYTYGYTTATMPSDLKKACSLLATLQYNNRSNQGIKSEKIGAYSITFGNGFEKGKYISGIPVPVEISALMIPYQRKDRVTVREF